MLRDSSTNLSSTSQFTRKLIDDAGRCANTVRQAEDAMSLGVQALIAQLGSARKTNMYPDSAYDGFENSGDFHRESAQTSDKPSSPGYDPSEFFNPAISTNKKEVVV